MVAAWLPCPPPLQVAPQPLWFSDTVANLRKLKELPHHLLHSGRIEELKQEVLGKAPYPALEEMEQVLPLPHAPPFQSLGRVKGKSQYPWLLLGHWVSPGVALSAPPSQGTLGNAWGYFGCQDWGRGCYWH